jgi:hypothetical protein
MYTNPIVEYDESGVVKATYTNGLRMDELTPVFAQQHNLLL